jgi:CMP-N,N'-diacetyllegionaminic acid synthase
MIVAPNLNILALIPARGGSKRLPGKNLRSLGGRPLIVWTAAAALGIPEIVDVLVSTDDPTIRDVAVAAGAWTPWLRPEELATDNAMAIDVCLHALDWYEAEKGLVDGLMLLQPTSPFRSSETISRGITLFKKYGQRPVIGVSPARSHPYWCYTADDDTLTPFVSQPNGSQRSQDLPPAFELNGAFYLVSPRDLRQRHALIGEDSIPLIIKDPREALDIDTEWDWKLAEAAL